MKFSASTLAFLATSALATPVKQALAPRATIDPKVYDYTEPQRAAAVIEAFRHAWTGYSTYAFPHDELKPLSDTSQDDFGGWGASAVDALSTAIIMQQADIVDQILDHVVQIDFSKNTTPNTISLFETTIRYLAGMLSGYDLLTGPFSSLAAGKTAEVQALLNQSKNLANVLKFAFNTTSGIPANDLNIASQQVDETNAILSQIGTLVIEWQHLSDLTGDQTYGQLARKGESYLLNPSPKYNVPFPGLLGTTINIQTGQIVSADGGWVGDDDSFYEYLLKAYVYDSKRFSQYKDRWVTAAQSTIKYLTSHPDPKPQITWVAAFNNKTLNLVSQHLACFDGGNFILGGQVLKNPTFLNYGLSLVDGCHATYNSTATQIGPEEFGWDPTQVPQDQAEFYNQHGFYIISPQYILRPEVIESYYYAWRATRDTKYRDWAWDAFVAINATARVASGFADLNNVNEFGGGGYSDTQNSFLFAEVLKYAYIIHLDDAVWQVENSGVNQYVFNTEAHPMKVQGTPI